MISPGKFKELVKTSSLTFPGKFAISISTFCKQTHVLVQPHTKNNVSTSARIDATTAIKE